MEVREEAIDIFALAGHQSVTRLEQVFAPAGMLRLRKMGKKGQGRHCSTRTYDDLFNIIYKDLSEKYNRVPVPRHHKTTNM